MTASDLIDTDKFKELRKVDPIKAKNLKKKLRKKKSKQKNKENTNDKLNDVNKNEQNINGPNYDSYVEYVEEDIDEGILEQFEDVYKKFHVSKEVDDDNEYKLKGKKKISFNDFYSDDEEEDEEEDDDDEEGKKKKEKGISKKQLKLLKRPSIFKLKEFAKKPELVDIWDTTSSDPFFYVWLKCLKNCVPVPQQWCQKRKYMHAKRGIEKLPYKLPPYIEDTKISEIRQAIKEKEEQKSLKQKLRERVRPKLHTMDIDYQTLHDAFFKYATKPKLVKFADVYYEGKEFELKTKKFRPGVISEKLRKALNIEPNDPLPWLVNMKKYGLPPSFPYLNIPSLNNLSQEQPTGVVGTGSNTIGLGVNTDISNNNNNNNIGKNIDQQQQTQNDGSKMKYENVDESGNIIYGSFISHRMNENNNTYPEDFLWKEMDENFENSEEEEEDNEEEKDEDAEEKEEGDKKEESENEDNKNEMKERKDKNDNIEAEYVNINLNDNLNEDILKNNYGSGIYSVGLNSKISGSYTPYMESGLTSVDLTSFVSGYDTPRYPYNTTNNMNYINTQNIKPYTILQTEEVPINPNNLFSSNVKYKIQPVSPPLLNKPSNISEGGITPFTNVDGNASYMNKGESTKNVQNNTNVLTIDDIRKELSKFEEISNKAKQVSAQVDNTKKVKKDVPKKKKKFFKF
uniref:PSP proline-rich domain-containing protein n=1 Tax=Piliocolobus tephrosceles TaxID=591936 RepID=A0A8C9GCZ2_9PRIM